MATLSSIGIGSGIDANSIVSQLVALERKPIEQLKTEADRIDARLSSFGRVQAAIDTLRTASRTLVDSGTWSAATVSTSDATAVSATATAGATSGSYAVQV
ncbi:MAG: flagellar hook protein, partial [Rubrivivax sp.]|nr:flagellar hook protein [Rubrivivax sp.]